MPGHDDVCGLSLLFRLAEIERRQFDLRHLDPDLVEIDIERLVEQGGIRVNGEKASSDTKLKDGDVLQAGKRSFVRIRLKKNGRKHVRR